MKSPNLYLCAPRCRWHGRQALYNVSGTQANGLKDGFMLLLVRWFTSCSSTPI